MLLLDVSTAYAICGAGALVGACMMHSPVAFGCLGIGLVVPVFDDFPLSLGTQALMVLGTLTALLLLAWAVSALAGRPRPRRELMLALAATPTLLAALWTQGPTAMVWLCALRPSMVCLPPINSI